MGLFTKDISHLRIACEGALDRYEENGDRGSLRETYFTCLGQTNLIPPGIVWDCTACMLDEGDMEGARRYLGEMFVTDYELREPVRLAAVVAGYIPLQLLHHLDMWMYRRRKAQGRV